MPLVTSQGYNLQSNPIGSAMQGYQQMGGLMDQRNARQQRDIQQGLAGEQREWLSGGGLTGEKPLEESAKFGAQFQQQVAGMLGLVDKRNGQMNQQGMDKMARFAYAQSQEKSPERQNENIMSFAQSIPDPAQRQAVLEMLDDSPEERKEMFETMAVANLPAKDFGRFLLEQRKAQAAESAPISALDKRKLAQGDRALGIKESLAQSKISKESGGAGQSQQLPTSITGNVSPELSQKLNDVFTVAGGGKDGMKAVEKALATGTEQERRAASPEILKTRFPQASPEEMQQLQSVVDSAKNTENGFKEATKLRAKQKQSKDFGAFKQKAAGLITRILENPELNDVIGSIEGKETGEFWEMSTWSDGESQAVADIQEVKDILTGDNLKLMSGVLSESDIRLLANLAGGALNRTRGEGIFRSDMKELQTKLMSMNASIETGKANTLPKQKNIRVKF